MKWTNKAQKNAAQEAMAAWLAHPQELGTPPAQIECAGEFDRHGLHYYLFKYKKEPQGRWLLGVCGGYEADALEHCGHVFSEMEEYHADTAEEQAIAMVETIRSYWMEQAKQAQERQQNPGNFVNFVLLEEPVWDKDALLRELKETWQIEDEPDPDEEERADDEDAFVLRYHGAMLAVSLMSGAIPAEEAERCAAKNYMWHEGVEQTRRHQAHLLVAVLGGELSPVESGKLLVKAVSACCQQAGTLGIYANETVYPPDYYQHFSGMLKEGLFPIYNLVWFGLYRGQNGMNGYTCGLRQFGYNEIEVIDSSAEPADIGEFLSDIAHYVITEGVTLQAGETIGFSEEQKLPITQSRGVAVEGDSLKIAFPG